MEEDWAFTFFELEAWMPLPINDLAEEEEHNNSANLKEVVEKCSLQESNFKGESELRKK